ncbi:hypothetical protein GCM10027290_20420 [Micromonospora sonneratiae]|uniref:PPE family protein n=1 Tax=Micromonospora sonneratiae TaxID=1184706 RepID=A0ABW3YIG1_9ACTN
MIKNDGGSGSSGTNWQSYTVPELWSLLKNHDTENHWKQVSGLRKTYELTQTHLSRLQQYRASLTESWPPEKSEAARVYVASLDKLIASVQDTYDTAQANYNTFSTATTAISQSRSKLQKLYNEYTEKQQKKQEYESRVAAEKDSLLPGTSPGKPPVTDAELKQLDFKARAIMSGLSGELVEARVQIRQPKPYQGRTIHDPSQDDGVNEKPPIIPPITVVGAPPSKPTLTAPPSGIQMPAPTAPSHGPVLGGASPSPAPPAAVTTPSNLITTTPPNSAGSGSGMLPPFSTGPGISSPYSPTSGGPIKPGTGGIVSAPRAMPPGGLIGGAPGMGTSQPGGAAPGRRINPVGGVIGNANPSARRNKEHPRRGHENTKHWDPDNPWETDEGVTPIVLPPPEPGRIDPGPAIGYNR